ncbi:MAG TPA: transglycosylase SLT domain-containing protein [Thermoanaerobaculia bacterium]|jgi:soluble lytic murein transglycosylase|nr:transglycosylase SLT domain-containing protein [Thermoanaerobaculia bacterium]
MLSAPFLVASFALALAGGSGPDPRPPLSELQRFGRDRDALSLVDREIAGRPRLAREIGLSYLRGHLLEGLGDERRAAEAFAAAMVETPVLAAYGRYRLALGQMRAGHPEVAAGLLAAVVAEDARSPLAGKAIRLFQRSLRDGGDCRLLKAITLLAFAPPERRALQLARADCAFRAGDTELGRSLLVDLLDESRVDDWAFAAAERLTALADSQAEVRGRSALLSGLVLALGGELDRAILSLQRAAHSASRRDRSEAAVSLGRVQLEAGRYDAAIAQLEIAAHQAAGPSSRAQARFDQGRGFEARGQAQMAAGRYLAAAKADPDGAFTAAAYAGALRLSARSGAADTANALLSRLAARPAWRTEAARAALFLAASDLVRGRADRARLWLGGAGAAGEPIEVAYWRARATELAGNPQAAVNAYLGVLRLDPYHLLSLGARRRLAGPGLAPSATIIAQRLTETGRPADLHSAWLILGDLNPLGRSARVRLAKLLLADRQAAPFLRLSPVPIARWPLWSQIGNQVANQPLPTGRFRAEGVLLSLGLWADGAAAAAEFFDPAHPELAFTAGLELARVGQTRRSIALADAVRSRAPTRVPEAFLPIALRRLLYPFPYADLLRREGPRRHIDPLLLAAILREESRFDPSQVRGAGRGLAGSAQATEARVAALAGLPEPGADDLERPEVAIPLAAAHLGSELIAAGGFVPRAIAAFEAGPEAARIWQGYCSTLEPEEYWTKMTDPAARAYLAAVISSWAHYREIYGQP